MTVLLVQLLIGSVWGITSALMKQGAMVAHERRRKEEGPLHPGPSGVLQRLPVIHDWMAVLLVEAVGNLWTVSTQQSESCHGYPSSSMRVLRRAMRNLVADVV